MFGEIEQEARDRWYLFLDNFPSKFGKWMRDIMVLRGIDPGALCRNLEIEDERLHQIVEGKVMPTYTEYLHFAYIYNVGVPFDDFNQIEKEIYKANKRLFKEQAKNPVKSKRLDKKS